MIPPTQYLLGIHHTRNTFTHERVSGHLVLPFGLNPNKSARLEAWPIRQLHTTSLHPTLIQHLPSAESQEHATLSRPIAVTSDCSASTRPKKASSFPAIALHIQEEDTLRVAKQLANLLPLYALYPRFSRVPLDTPDALESARLDAAHVINEWGKSTISKAFGSWRSLLHFYPDKSHESDFSAKELRDFLAWTHETAISNAATKKSTKANSESVFDHDGSSVRRNTWEGLEFLRNNMQLKLASNDISVSKPAKQRTRRARPSKSISLRMVIDLERLACNQSVSLFARAYAGAFAGMCKGCSRMAQFQRSTLALPSTDPTDGTFGCFVGYCALDKHPKTKEPSQWFIPTDAIWDGARDWYKPWLNSLDDVAQMHFLLRDTDSPTGDPFKASKWLDRPILSSARQNHALRSLLAAASGMPKHETLAFGTSSCRHFLPNVARSTLESAEVKAEIGHWAGSTVKSIIPEDPLQNVLMTTRSSLRAMPERYASDSLPAVICKIMTQMVLHCKEVVQTNPEAIPLYGGWRLFGGTPSPAEIL